MPEEKITATDLVNKIIDYFSSSIVFSDKVDIYSFLVGSNTSSIRDKRLFDFVQEKNDHKPKNRLFTVLIFDDKNRKPNESRRNLRDSIKRIKHTFYVEILETLSLYCPDASYEFLNDKPGITIANYIILVLNFPGKSSIEFVITTYGLNKNSKLFDGSSARFSTIQNHAELWEDKRERFKKSK